MEDFRLRMGIILVGLLCLLSSCSPFSSKKSPIILILLESFSEQNYLCSDPRLLEGLTDLQTECEEFIRFTHVYAPSKLSQPSLASLVTGKEISEHGVSHNGAQAISARFHTLAESALNFKMRTGLFSGGTPLLKKFGVSQGYEEFNDGFQNKKVKLFRPFQETVEKSLKWIDGEVGQRSFFMTLYVPDLLYKSIITTDNLDDERPIARHSNIQEVYESIDNLIHGLKQRKKWKNANMIILGVGGRKTSLRPANPLRGAELHVPLQIKLSKSIDTNLKDLTGEMVSFAKLGKWIERLIFHKPSQGALHFSPSPEEMLIPQQATWSQWLGLSNWSTFGLRKRQYLFSYNPQLEVYDRFFDKKEFEKLSANESSKISQKLDIHKKIKKFFPEPCRFDLSRKDCPRKTVDEQALRDLSMLLKWSEVVWSSEKPIDNMSQLVSRAVKGKSVVAVNWLAYHALYQKKWTSLFELGKHIKNQSWMMVAQANLRETIPFEPKGCLKYFLGESHSVDDFYKACQDSELRRVVEGISLLKNKKRPSESFWSQVNQIKNIRRAKNINLKMLFINDIESPFNFAPKLSELYFFLPGHADYLNLIDINET